MNSQSRTIILGTLSVMVLWSGLSNAQSKVPTVQVERAQSWQGGVENTLYCRGEVPFYQYISSHVNAELTSILPAGTIVKKGQQLATQNTFYLLQQREQLQAQILSAEAQYQHSFNEYQRLLSLGDKEYVSGSELQQHQLDYQLALQSKELHNRQDQVLKYQLQRLQHKAPSDGVILQLNSSPGQWVAQGQSILIFQPAEQHEIHCQISLQDYNQFTPLDKASFTLEGGTSLDLLRRSGKVERQDQTLTLVFASSNATADNVPIEIGQRYQVTMQKPNQQLSQVPYDALSISQDDAFIWVVSEDNTVSRQATKIIQSMNTSAVIDSVIKQGDRVVIKGKRGLKDNMQVMVEEVSLLGAAL